MPAPTPTNVPDALKKSKGIIVKWKNFVFNLTGTVQARPAHNQSSTNQVQSTAKDYNTSTPNRTYQPFPVTVTYDPALYAAVDAIYMQTGSSEANGDDLEIYDSLDDTTPGWTHWAAIGGVTDPPTGEIESDVTSMTITFDIIDKPATGGE